MVDKERKLRIGTKKDESTDLPISLSLAQSGSPSTYSSFSSPPVGVFLEIDYSEEIIEETPLTCAVCQDTYSDPRILPCLHSFCKGCLSKLASIFTFVKCPLCRNEHTLSPKGVDELLSNTQLARKVETLSTTTEKLKCDQCESDATDVVSFCSNCETYLCESCDGAHKKMLAFKSHELVLPKLAKKNPKVKSFMCPKHTSEPLTVYCIICKSVICRDCGLYDHNGHKFKPAVKASDEIRKSLVSNSKQLTTKLKIFRSHAEEVAKVEKHVTVYPDEMKSFITSQFEELHKLLEKRKEALLQQVDTQYNGFSKTLWVEKDIVETGICKLEAGIKFAQQLAESDDKLEVAVLGTKALESMERINKTLSWDPKSIKNLGPLAYAAQEFDRFYIERTGSIKDIEIVIKNGNYMHITSEPHDSFFKNGKYCIEIEVKAEQNFKILFPQMNMLCSCKRGNDVVSCTTECKQDKWEATFLTEYAGSYTIEAILRINGEDCCRQSKNITLFYANVLVSSISLAASSDLSPSLSVNDKITKSEPHAFQEQVHIVETTSSPWVEKINLQDKILSSAEAHSSWTHSPSSVGMQSSSLVATRSSSIQSSSSVEKPWQTSVEKFWQSSSSVEIQSSSTVEKPWQSSSSVGMQSSSLAATIHPLQWTATDHALELQVTDRPLQYSTINSPSASMGMQSSVVSHPSTAGYGITSVSMLKNEDNQHVPERNRANISRNSMNKKSTEVTVTSSNQRAEPHFNESKGRVKKKQYQ